MLRDSTIDQLLKELASKSPTPGGGTVAGLSGAISSSLVSMVCELTIGKRRYRQYEDELKNVLENSEKLREEFLLLAEKDTEVFSEVMEAYGLPHESDEDKHQRNTAVEEATKRAAMVAMDTLRRCEAVGQLCLTLALKGNENSISDVGVASIMSHAAAKSASLNILLNLSTITDEDFKGKLNTEQAKVLKNVKYNMEETCEVVDQKL